MLQGMLRCLKGEQETIDKDLAAADFHPLQIAREKEYGYDIQFIINGESLNIENIRDTVVKMGDCVLVVGNSKTVKVHVHSLEPGIAINYGASIGSLDRVIVENMDEQYQNFILRSP